MKATCCVTHIHGIPAVEYEGANDCEHCRMRPETDSVDMIIAGCDRQSMETVRGRLQEIGGGAVYAIDTEIIAEFPAPLGGVVSLKSMGVLREEIKKLEAALRSNGVPWQSPLLTIDVLGTAAIPHLRITHKGYVRVKDRELLQAQSD